MHWFTPFPIEAYAPWKTIEEAAAFQAKYRQGLTTFYNASRDFWHNTFQ